MDETVRKHLTNLEDIAELLKNDFVAKDELIEMLVTCAIAQEHLLIVGPPGTAKSEVAKRFAHYCSPIAERGHAYFEYLLTRFTEPNEIFGPVDIKAFQSGGGHHRVVAGMLPQAEIAFLDEVFKANSAILNALLTVLNERTFYNGGQPQPVPLLFAVGATNEVPTDPTLSALYDRFLVRIWTDNVEDTRFHELVQRGWKLERDRISKGYGQQQENLTTTSALHALHRSLLQVKLDPIADAYREVVRRIRAEGIELSDRRVVKLLKLVAAAALRRKSLEANRGDFWVLKHVWREPNQIPHLEKILDDYVGEYATVQWSAERDLPVIANEINVLAGRQPTLRTDADYADFLHQANRLRTELTRHSDATGRQPHLAQLAKLIENAMQILEQQA